MVGLASPSGQPPSGFPQIVTSPSMGGGPSSSMAFDSSSSVGSSIFFNAGGSSKMNWEPVRNRLLGTDMEDALAAATELRQEIFSLVHTTEFPLLLSALLPAFSTILTHKTRPTPDTTSTQHKLRNTILELLSRMPSNEVLRPHAPHLVAVALDVLNRDYEENALLASKIIFDLYKIYRSLPHDYVQPFLDFVVSAFKALPGAVQRNFTYQVLMHPPTPGETRNTTAGGWQVPSTAESSMSRENPPLSVNVETSTPAKTEKSSSVDPTPMDTGPDKSSPGDTSKTPRDDDNATGTPSSATTPAGQTPASVTSFTSMSLPKSPARLSPHSVASFRVLTECPLIVMLMFQLYPKYLRGNISTLIQVMMEALGLRPPSIDTIEHRYQQALRAVASTQQSIIDAESTTTPTQSNSPQKDRQNDPKLDGAARRRYFSKCRELVAAQAKTLSFLTYLLRGFSNDLKPYEDRLAGNVISLMANCPREFISTRKELLVASRHLLNSEFRNGFFRHVDALLDEKNLMGSHHRSDSEQSALRPLVYAMLSDLVQQMRSLLSLRQISRVVTIFSRVLHDTSIPGSTQYTAVRTLLTVVDSAFQSKDPDIQLGRDILVRVLRTLVEKLSSLNAQRDSMEKNGTSGETCCNTNRDETSTPVDPKQQPLKDQKNIVKAIIVGAKTLIWYINNYRNQREKEKVDSTPPRIGTNEEIASALAKITHTERDLIDRYIVLAFPSIDMMKEICAEDEEATPGDAERAAAEAYRETLTYFASAFTSLDGYELRKILGKRLDVFVNAVKDDSTAIVVPRHLLSANKSTSFEFCSMMLNFLVERMDNLALSTEENVRFFSVMTDDEASSTNQITLLQTLFKDNESHQKNDLQGISSAYLQLFERVLKSLSAYPENERAVRPHLKSIVAMCVRGCCETTDFRANNYCMLLRYVFRSISAGKFEESYRELFPLIPGVLNGLFRVLSSTRLTPLRHTLIELVVTVPARLSTLLPHLNLLLRVIVLALDSSCEELINLGLRTLEFWLDNLNPEYLFPEVSKDKKVYVAVMKALSTHLKPAPYPYGLLTLRLLGKLGGKNRQVLRDPIDICDPKLILNRINDEFSLECEWLSNSANAEGVNDTQMEIDRLETKTFSIHLPLSRCVELLKRIALVQTLLDEGPVVDESSSSLRWMGCEQLNSVNISNLDLLPFCKDVIHNTSVGQAKAALKILRTSLVTILNTDAASRGVTRSAESSPEMQVSASNLTLCNNQLHAIALGCLFGCFLGNEEVLFTKGLLAEMFAIVSRNEEHIVRVDSNGSVLEIAQAEESKVGNEEFGASSDDEKMGSLRPFGYFEMNGPFESTANPLVVTRALAQFLSQPSDSLNALGLDILKYILELPKTIHVSKDRDESKHSVNELDRGSMIFFESLLSSFCEHCIASDWSTRDGLFDGLCLIVETLGSGWAKRYECELMNVVLFSVKSAPHEISIAGVKSFQFMMRLCSNIYGTPHFIQSPSSAKPFMFDLLSPWKKKDIVSMEDKPAHNTSDSPKIQSVSCPSDDVLQIVINEMASTKYMARLSARYILEHYCFNAPGVDAKKRLEKHLPLLRRVLFSRSLRLLPLLEQVGVVEALAVLVDQLPHLIPLDDQHLLAFLSELLKMASVADGEMNDSSLLGAVVDRNGFVVGTPEQRELEVTDSVFRSSSLFLRRDCVITMGEGRVVISEELPPGVQLRVSSIELLRAVIRGHPDPFFDAETSTPVGNIRPHVISLLFRSLVSHPIQAVTSAHDALRDVLTLSVVTTEGPEGVKSKSRLRKELLQTCIRPVLLNLRDFTRLNVVLLRGLEQLLSLLSSWFNKTLGEKLLDHLQKWMDPNRIKAQKIWKLGKEPEVPAAIIGLFALLPQASNFVDQVIKTTIKLEACLPAYRSQVLLSPYRKPLAKYLNKYNQYAAAFFLNRLRTPLYSELFLDIIQFDESKQLRDHLKGRQCSVSLLSICFERPLAIIRSEKEMGTSGSGSSPSRSSNNEESLGLHGIQPHPSLGDQKEVVLLREVEAKQRQLKIYQQDFMKAKEVVLAKGPLGNGPGATPEGKVALEDAKKQLRITRTACDKVSKDLADVRKRYADEVAQKKAADQQTSVKDQSTVRPMIIDSLELQHQGFCLVNALVRDDVNYLQDHTDILRAFRWLWRSKGRFLRMQYEESIPPRYHGESQALGSFLVSYSRSSPHDVDLLFELIRIFLQPMTSDFWFIRKFLNQATGNGLEDGQKKQILERFFALMGGDSSEEIKALSLQLVIYPTLYFSFHKQPSGLSSEETPATASNSLQPKSCGFLDSITVQKFISDVLFKNGKPVTCDDRLVVGFLQISDLFLEFVPHYFENKGDEMLKYCWVHLKNEIPSCKSWAQFVICRYISVFSMPQQMILQVYDALLDSHQQEGKQLIQNGLDLLVSTFPQKLDRSGLKAAVDTTIKVMFKEANSTAQLSHIFHVIVHEPDIFFHKRSVLASFMINSLNRLGLPPNSPTENRILAVLMIELVVKWEKGQEKIEESEDAMDISAETGSEDTAFPDIPVRFDCAMVETIINFLIRLKILLADPKVDTTTVNIQPKLDLLLQDILNKWKGALIRPIYFEKVVSMCNEDEEVHIRARLIQNTESQHSTKGSRSPEGRSAGKDDEIKKSIAALNGIMIACLDIFKFLAVGDPLNPFLMENTVQLKSILGACFRCASFLGEVKLRRKLFDFLIPYLSLIAGDTPMIDVQVVHSITVWVEKILIDAEVEHRTGMTSLGGELSRHTRPRQMMPPDDSHLEDCPTMFALKVVKMVRDNASPFSKTFTSTLLALLGTIVKQHTLQAGSNQKQNGVNYNPLAGTVSIRHMYPTPTFGLLEETELAATHHLVGIGKPTEDKHLFPYKEVKNHDVMLHFGTMILDVVGKDDLVFEFSWCRKSLLSLLQSILDTSDNIQIMLAAVHLVGRWLVAGDSGPLTTKERTVFLGKIASFDFTGISEVASQPLVEVVSFYLKSLFHCDGPKRVQDVVDKHEMMLRRSISACLVSANVETRDFMLNLFLQEECTEPFAVLWRFFNGDLEGLGGRHWVIVLVELLLRIITPKEEHGTTENLPPPTPRFVLKESDMGAGGQLEYLAFAERLQEDAMDMSTKKGGEELKVALRQLAHGDPRICQSLFETIFPSAWHSVADIHLKESMASRIESFLSQSFHSQSFKKDFSFSEAPQNSIKSFLSGLVKLDPGPIFDIDLLMHLARSYNCWYEAMFMLENQYFALSASSLSSEGKKKLDKLLLGMRYCYRELGEVDIWTSLVLKSCHVPGSKFAASLDIYGKVDKALEAFSGLIELVDSEESLGASEFEMDFWEERWVHLHQQQQQLDVVSEYAKQSQNERLMLECAWRERDWDKVRSLCSSGPIVAAVEAGDPAMKICETLSAVADGKLADVENLHAQASQLALYQWQFLPCLSSGSGAHARLLHYFHRLVEIRESGQIMVETNNHSSGKTLPDLKNLLNAWRHRLPNDEENMVMWDEIFTWRSHMFQAVTSNFHWSEPSTLATLHDRPWTAIRMATVARKQGMRETSLLLLNRITDSRAMDVSDAYLRLREQTLFYNNPESELERTGGLNMINTTNLSYFDSAQKAELFRLKAIFLASLRRTSKSNQAYCHSVQICPIHTKSWISWGGLCSSLGAMTEKQAEHAKANGSEGTKEARAAATKKVAQYLAQAMGCFIEAVQIDHSERSRIHLPKVLWMLTKDGLNPGVLCQTLENRGTKLPPWVWLPWIPQLLTGLCRIEGRAIRSLLSRVVKAHPQAVYYSLRSFYLERRDVERAKGGGTPPGQHMGSVAFAEEMMSTLRRSHASLWSSLEAILEELIVKFRPSYEEELLATISALLERAESHSEKQSLPDKKRIEEEEALVASWSKTLSRIAAKFFKETEPASTSNRRDERVRKTAEFKRKYKKDFEEDFKLSSGEGESAKPDPKPHLQEYIAKLQSWKQRLEGQVSRTPSSLPLMESSNSLAMVYGDVPDLWPGSCDTKHSSGFERNHEAEEYSRSQSTASSSAATARNAALNAALAAASAAAREGVGGDYGGGSAAIEIPGQYCPNSLSWADNKPCAELHAHLVKFEPFVEVVRRNDQLVRRCGMIGSDGRTYRFLLQFAIPHWTRSDERTAQTSYVIDQFIRKNLVARRARLSVQPCAAIPVAQRLRMTPDNEFRLALDEVIQKGMDPEVESSRPTSTVFLDEITSRLKEKVASDSSEEDKTKAEQEVRLDVYQEVCSKVGSRVFLCHLQKEFESAESFFLFRRSLSVHLSANSLLQYIFSVAERTPQRFVVLLNNGRVMSPDFRVSYSNQGFIENPAIPYRMTPNIEAALGEHYIQGIFIRSMAMISGAVKQHKEEFDPILRLLMRDDILSWYTKSQAKSDSKTQELERQLIERVSKNVYTLQSRIAECTPSSKTTAADLKACSPLDKRANDLLKAAKDPQKLCMMPASYHAWL